MVVHITTSQEAAESPSVCAGAPPPRPSPRVTPLSPLLFSKMPFSSICIASTLARSAPLPHPPSFPLFQWRTVFSYLKPARLLPLSSTPSSLPPSLSPLSPLGYKKELRTGASSITETAPVLSLHKLHREPAHGRREKECGRRS
eukprot:scaffold193957_cov26-Tisochrysis_lutea.AAC.1